MTLNEKKKTRRAFLDAIAEESAFHRLFDHLPGISFFAKDRDFRLMCANRHFIERFGFKKEDQIIGKSDFDLFPPSLAENFRRDDEGILKTGRARLGIVELFFNRQGIPDWFITNKMPVIGQSGKVIGVMGTTQSYEGRKQMLQPYGQISAAVEFIREHFRERIRIEQLAALAHLSSRQLHRKFIESFGLNPQAFIMKLRIQAACEVLQKGAQISATAREVGFYDQSIFTHQFHKHLGITPMKYQRQFGVRP
jgi:PAS domain S-box-containing protein